MDNKFNNIYPPDDQKLKQKIDYIYMALIKMNRAASEKPTIPSVIIMTKQAVILAEQFQSLRGEERKNLVLSVLIKIIGAAARLTEDEKKFLEDLVFGIIGYTIDALVALGNLDFRKIGQSCGCIPKSEPV